MSAHLVAHARSLFRRILTLALGRSDAPIDSNLGRSSARYRKVLLGGIAGGGAKAIAVATTLISVPLTVRYLGTERFGMWMTVSSVLALLSFADLGIGNGLVSAVARCDGRGDRQELRRVISSSFFLLSGVAALLLAAFCLVYPHIRWSSVFGIHSGPAAQEAGPAILALIACFTINLPLGIVQRVQVGLQDSWLFNLWQAAGSLLGLAAVLAAIWLEAGVPWLILAMTGGPVISMLANGLVEFTIRRPDLLPRWRDADSKGLKSIVTAGGMFFVLQLLAVVGTATDSVIIAQVIGPAGVAQYAVTYKLFQITLIFAIFLQPLWPAFGEAIARGDRAWARSALNRATAWSSGVALLLAVAILLFGRTIIRTWLDDGVVPDQLLVAAIACWVVLAAYGGVLTTLLNNEEFLRRQVVIYGAASLVALALKVPMAHWLGPAGVVWATVAAYSLLYCWPARVLAEKSLSRKD